MAEPNEIDECFPILRNEADGVIEEIQFAVEYAALSKTLCSSDDIVYFNIKTLEKNSYCIELSTHGFRVCMK